MQNVNITPEKAADLAVTNGVTVSRLEELGFTIVAGDVQVAAADAAPAFAVNPELVAHAAALYAAGRSAKDTNSGRSRSVLSEKDGLYPYRVSVTHAE
jgi:hypothetical protein